MDKHQSQADGPPADATSRFSSRVENYIRYRPRYPESVIDLLRTECALTPDGVIADIGSGTGILSELFLRNGNPVYAVEPNREMREAGERLLGGYPNFHSIDGAAEATTLAANSVDVVVAGTAFHWFELAPTRREFARILKLDGRTMLVWNIRPGEESALGRDYEALLRTYGIDYAKVSRQRIDDAVVADFFSGDVQTRTFANRQSVDYAGLEGRLRSSSYSPEPGHAHYGEMIATLKELFAQHSTNGQVVFEYQTKAYMGRLT